MLALFADVRAVTDALVTDTVARVSGRPAIRFREFARDHAATFRAAGR